MKSISNHRSNLGDLGYVHKLATCATSIQIIVFLLFLLFFNSCNKKDNQIKVGVCVVETTEPVYTRMKKAMLENEERLGVKVIWGGVKDEVRRMDYVSYQEDLVFELYEEGIKALIFNPIIDSAVYPLVHSAKNKEAGRNIPVIALDKVLVDLRFDAYITTNEQKLGEEAASCLVEKIQGQGNVIVLEGPPGDKKLRDIVLGFYKVLDQYPNIRIVSSRHLSEENSAYDHVGLMLNRYAGNIQGVIACDSSLIVGAVDAIDIQNLTDLIITVGVGASQEACSLLKPNSRRSKHDLELYSGHYDRGRLALETAVKLINGEIVEYDEMLPNGRVEVKTSYGPIRQLTWKNYYSEVKDLWPELFVENDNGL